MATKMEDKDIVFQLARDSLNRHDLESFLRGKPQKEIKMLLDSSNTDGITPLLMAAVNGRDDVVKYLLDNCDVDVNQVGNMMCGKTVRKNITALYCAAAAGHLDVVKTMLYFGADTNHTINTGCTALHEACFRGYFDIVKMLIDYSGDVNAANEDDQTSLMFACDQGHYDIAKLLIDNDANIHSKDFEGGTALHRCAWKGNLEILKMLLCHDAKYDDVDSKGMTPLFTAAAAGHAPIVEYLLSRLPYKRQKKVDALELLGAMCMHPDHKDILAAAGYWRRAMNKRYESPVFPLVKPNVQSPIAAYFGTKEVSTITELEELISDIDQMRMQALLILERNFPRGSTIFHLVVSMLWLVLKRPPTYGEMVSIFGMTLQEVYDMFDQPLYTGL